MSKSAPNAQQANESPANESPAIVAVRKSDAVRPEVLANALGVSGKLVRGFLRQTYTRPIEAKGTTWVLTSEQANATLDHFIARRSPVVPNANAEAPTES